MKAMVLAAGLGTRMRPLTDTLPKPLLTVAGKTLVDHALDWLESGGVHEAVVNSFYKAELLEAHLARRTRPTITVSREHVLLETGGGIKNALRLLGGDVFVSTNADVICRNGATHALTRLAQAWDDSADALLLVHPLDKAVGYDGPGDFFVDGGGHVQRRRERAHAPFVFTGTQLLHPRFFVGAPDGPFSMNLLYDQGMDAQGNLPRVRALVHDGDWLHVGDPESLQLAEAWFCARNITS